jgi:sugar/nucleoside kinase (ribokinase family)
VLVVGDANPDLVLRGDVVPRFGQAEQLLEDASLVVGGSAAITAHGLARLDRPVALVAAVGEDTFGERLRGELSQAGIDISRVVVRPGLPTGLTVVLSRGEDRAMLTLTGAIDSLTPSEVLAAVEDPRGGARHLHLASLYLQPGLAAGLPDVLRTAHEAGLTTSVDTNDDPTGQWDGIDALLAHLDVLLPNRAEAIALGRDQDPRRAAATLAARGPLVVVKQGSVGAFAVTPDGEVVEVDAVSRPPVDTTGAGDTFDAAFLDAWMDDAPLRTALRRAVAAGSLSVGATGGTAGQPTRDQIDRALRDPAATSGETS